MLPFLSSRKRPTKVQLWTALALLLLIALVVVVGAAETGLRLLMAKRHGTAATVEQYFAVDQRIGIPVPIASLRLGRIQTSSLGFRGPEIPVPKPADMKRIAFVGASTTWCAEVSGNDNVWTHLVTEDLRKHFQGSNIDYVNAGVPGYRAQDSLKNFEQRVAGLRPDIVVIYHATNDMSGELRRLAAANGLIPEAKGTPPSWLARQSLLWNLAEKNVRIWVAQSNAEKNVGRLEVEAATLGGAFRADLANLVRRAQDVAAVVAVATFSVRIRRGQTEEQQLQSAASALYYMPFMTPSGLIESYARYNQVIREVAADTGALLIEGEHDIPGDAQHFTDSVHFTDAGSRAMANRISSALRLSPRVEAVLARD